MYSVLKKLAGLIILMSLVHVHAPRHILKQCVIDKFIYCINFYKMYVNPISNSKLIHTRLIKKKEKQCHCSSKKKVGSVY